MQASQDLPDERFRLDSKVVIITGAAGLIGQAFCFDIAKSGAAIILADIDEKKGMELEKRINQKFDRKTSVFVQTDITNLDSVTKLIEFTLNKFEKIDALVNNAYPRNKKYGAKFEDVTYKNFCENVNLHLGGYFLIIQQIAKVMTKQKYGNIINMSSIYGFAAPEFGLYQGTDMTVPVEYAAVKGAIINLTKYLAAYLGRYNIRVNSISPGGVFNNQPESFVKKYSQLVPLGNRMADTDDLTGTLIFLLSDASKYLTGQNIVIDGGWTL